MRERCMSTTLGSFSFGNIQKWGCGGYYIAFRYVKFPLEVAIFDLAKSDVINAAKDVSNVLRQILESEVFKSFSKAN